MKVALHGIKVERKAIKYSGKLGQEAEHDKMTKEHEGKCGTWAKAVAKQPKHGDYITQILEEGEDPNEMKTS